ncbi:hypothetical protein KZ483_12400 [Paenibacillus sp. sptzw28]|uniref:hypothetical protein n=1 Tax=Paenibacillus sp. sptzw28 TaxID=715179 RepID=UPI001C6DEB2E|nr:hypothetical protein [Paenibacillus sp. sptzw28]QYR23620.1 hypothetical protein KZ483_12400 [Paenibacillus sp. sptzw28]
MTVSVTYLEWSDMQGKVLQTIDRHIVGRDELFIRKLVNASVIHNVLYEHTSNESELSQHAIYVIPFRGKEIAEYGRAIESSLSEFCDVAMRIEPEFWLWDNLGNRFIRGGTRLSPGEAAEIAQLLLDHYIVTDERTYECIYTVMDTDRRKALFYLKEVKA